MNFITGIEITTGTGSRTGGTASPTPETASASSELDLELFRPPGAHSGLFTKTLQVGHVFVSFVHPCLGVITPINK